MLFTAEILQRYVDYCIESHDQFARRPENRVRRIDGKTPYSVHCLWAATMLLHEANVPEELRIQGALALIFHDLLEDTTRSLPEWCDPAAAALVHELTCAPGEVGLVEIQKRSPEARLIKIYDSTSNLLQGNSMPLEYREYTLRRARELAREAEERYGSLRVAAILESYRVQ